jgi:hypothetical protein
MPNVSQRELLKQTQDCLDLLREIHDANERIIHRGRTGNITWSKILKDTYHHVCETCERRRLGTEPPDPYFDVICLEHDVATVCKRKWKLGETLDDYRILLNRLSKLPLDHHGLELLIRRSVTQPNCSPLELESAVSRAIEATKRTLLEHESGNDDADRREFAKKTKIFLASSSELKEDRKEFEILINRKNKQWVDRGVFLELVIWEDFLDALSKTRLQDEYNRAIKEADIFVMLFSTKVGPYTEEEFDAAVGQFKATNKPVVYTYFKDSQISTAATTANPG